MKFERKSEDSPLSIRLFVPPIIVPIQAFTFDRGWSTGPDNVFAINFHNLTTRDCYFTFSLKDYTSSCWKPTGSYIISMD